MFPVKDTVPNSSFPSATWLLIALSGIVFYFETIRPQDVLDRLRSPLFAG